MENMFANHTSDKGSASKINKERTQLYIYPQTIQLKMGGESE